MFFNRSFTDDVVTEIPSQRQRRYVFFLAANVMANSSGETIADGLDKLTLESGTTPGDEIILCVCRNLKPKSR